jgi:hypothetical protein
MNENVFEFFKDDDRMSVTLSQVRYITRFKKLATEHPEEVDYIINKDGSLFGHMPVSYLRLIAPRKLTDEQKHALAEMGRNSALMRGQQPVSRTSEGD